MLLHGDMQVTGPGGTGAGGGSLDWRRSGGLTELRTPRLLLRGWRDADRDPLASMNRDPQVVRYLPGPMGRAATDAMVDRLQAIHAELGYTLWVVEVTGSERGMTRFAGLVGLSVPSFDPPFEHADPCVEVGWRLSARWWGMGVASEAARAAVAFGFDIVGLPEIVSFTTPANEPSWRVMERIGMRRAAEFDHPRASPSDAWRRHVLYRMSPTDPRT